VWPRRLQLIKGFVIFCVFGTLRKYCNHLLVNSFVFPNILNEALKVQSGVVDFMLYALQSFCNKEVTVMRADKSQ